MDQVKQIVHYPCRDTVRRLCTGRGITAAVLDTGLAPHPDLKGRVLAFKDCIGGRRTFYDESGHGTHVAGILAGDGKLSGGVLAGMAPEAKLVILKVLDEKGEGNIAHIIEGIEWIKRNWRRYGIRIVNLSAGAKEGLDAEKERRLVEAVEELWDIGLVVVVSAGNYGPGRGTVAIPGTSKKVITVGAIGLRTENGKGGRTEVEIGCSGQGPTSGCIVKPDLVAPGYRIISCNKMTPEDPKPYTIKSGTSMATPVVAGAVALLLSKYPDMSSVEVKLRLRESCVRIGDAGMYGWGCLMVDRLLAEK